MHTQFVGNVERRDGDVVQGWVVDQISPLAPVAMEVVCAGQVLDRFIANKKAVSVGIGHQFEHAKTFEYRLNKKIRNLDLAFVPSGSVMPLALAEEESGTEVEENVDSHIDGFLEHITEGRVSGWVKYSSRPDVAVKLQIFVDGRQVGEGIANLFRADLAEVFGTSGFHAYDIAISVKPANGVVVDVRPFGSSRPLPRIGGRHEEQAAPIDTFAGSLDTVDGGIAAGWAYDAANPNEPCEVEFLVNDAVIGTTWANLFREDVRAAGFGNGVAGFRAELNVNIYDAGSVVVRARVKNGGMELGNSPRSYGLSSQMKKWLKRAESLTAAELAIKSTTLERAHVGETLSIVMPVYNANLEWLAEAIESVRRQWCPCWELVLVDDASTSEGLHDVLRGYADSDPRITAIFSVGNGGIARATNVGINAASGDYIAFMDHDDVLEPDAVQRYLGAAAEGDPDLIYCDELITGSRSDSLVRFCARPSFSYDYYLSHPYFVHMVCTKRSLALEIGGWDEAKTISGDVDFVLRLLSRARKVCHIPAVLYRWRTHAASAGHAMLGDVTEATIKSLNHHFNEIGLTAVASEGLSFNQYRIDYPDRKGKVLIVVPTKNQGDLLKKCVDSIYATTSPHEICIVIIDHESDDVVTLDYLNSLGESVQVMKYAGPFNYSAMNNLAIERYGDGCSYVLLLNNDVEALEAGWLERLRSLAGRADVGVVGATLLYPDRTIQHSGVIVGLNGAADHAHKFAQYELEDGVRNPGYLGALSSVRDYSAITAACLMMRMDVFRAVEGLDENLEVGFNDTDLCLRVVEHGLKCLIDPYAVLIHHESATRVITKQVSHPEDTKRFIDRWEDVLKLGDRFYNPLLLLHGPDHVLGDMLDAVYVDRISDVIPPTNGQAVLG